MTFLSTLLLSCSLLTVVSNSASVEVRKLAQVDAGIELENIAVRSNGKLLLTGLNSPTLHQFNPRTEEAPIAIAQIPNVNSLFGIVEIFPDVFAIAAGNYSKATSAVANSFSIWALDVGGCGCNETEAQPVLSKILDMPSARFLNGMTRIPTSPSAGLANATILVTDTILGQIYHIDPTTGAQESILKSNATGTARPASLNPGVNGIKFLPNSNTLYYTNTISGTFGSIELSIDYSNGSLPSITAARDWKVVASSVRGDDFVVAADGTAFISGNPVNTVFQVTPNGIASTLLGGVNSTETPGPTSAAFGRTPSDRDSLYITTNGIPLDVNTTISEGGRVLLVTQSSEESEGKSCT